MMCAYPSSPGVVGQYILFKPNFFAAEPVVSPMQAMELFQLSTFGIRFNQALSAEEATATTGADIARFNVSGSTSTGTCLHTQVHNTFIC